ERRGLRAVRRVAGVARMGRVPAFVRCQLALAVGDRDAARHPARHLVRGPRFFPRRRASPAGPRAARVRQERSRRSLPPDRLQVGGGRGARGGGRRRAGDGSRAPGMTAGVSLAVLLVILGSSIAVGAGIALVGLVLNQLYSPMPLTRMMGELAWSTTSNFILTAIPFYIMFGEILLRSGIAERMYNAMTQWLSWLPGGLMHSNVGSCALFGSVLGSGVATAATIGVVA